MRSSLPAVGFVGVKRAETLKGEVSSFRAVQQSERKDIPAREEREHGGKRTELSTGNLR